MSYFSSWIQHSVKLQQLHPSACTHARTHRAYALLNYNSLDTTHLCTLSKHETLQGAEFCNANIYLNKICTFLHAGTISSEVTDNPLPDNPLTSGTSWNLESCLLYSQWKRLRGEKNRLAAKHLHLMGKKQITKGNCQKADFSEVWW